MRPGVAYSIEHPLSKGFAQQQTKFRLDRVQAAKRFRECDWKKPFVALDAPLGPSPTFSLAYRQALVDSIRQSIPTFDIVELASFDDLVALAKTGRAPMYLNAWRTVPEDFGYPSTSLGVADFFTTTREIRRLAKARDARAVERKLLDQALVIPILHSYLGSALLTGDEVGHEPSITTKA